MDEYWRKWNQPVHKWLMRTVYFPSMRLGLPQFAAILMVFFISAFFHELLVGVPLQMLRAWAFMGMMGQVSRHSGDHPPVCLPSAMRSVLL